jgi:hypothetical protein
MPTPTLLYLLAPRIFNANMPCINLLSLCGKNAIFPKPRETKSNIKMNDNNVNGGKKPISRITYFLAVEDWEVSDTTLVERNGSELSESDYIIVEDREWSDDNLMDNSRPGRRCVADNKGVKSSNNAQETSVIAKGDEPRLGGGCEDA